MTSPPKSTPWLRFRVFIAGKMRDEQWIDVTRPDEEMNQIRDQHVKLVLGASILGLKWIVEVFDPDLPEAEAYCRYGTDNGAMSQPIEFSTMADAARLFRGRRRSTVEPEPGRTVNVDDAFANLAEHYDDAGITNLSLPGDAPVADYPAYKCPECGKVSHDPFDAENGYCAQCHAFTRDGR